MPPNRSLALAFDSIERLDLKRMGHLRLAYGAWIKSEAGEPIDSDEASLAEEFERLWREALLAGDRKFVFRLARMFDPSYSEKRLLREAALATCVKLHKSSPTWEQIKAEVEKTYGIKRDPDTWKKLRASEPFRRYF